jgi:hypothetical protein
MAAAMPHQAFPPGISRLPSWPAASNLSARVCIPPFGLWFGVLYLLVSSRSEHVAPRVSWTKDMLSASMRPGAAWHTFLGPQLHATPACCRLQLARLCHCGFYWIAMTVFAIKMRLAIK